MKRKIVLILCLVMIFLTGCMGNPNEIIEQPENPSEEIKQKLPSEFSLDNLEISVEEIIEAIQYEFNDGDTKVILTNKDGNYLVANYMIKNNESYEIDIDHSVEILVMDVLGQVHSGEYYEYKTGKENITIGPGEEKMVSFVCDLNIEEQPNYLTFKYKDKTYKQKAEVE